MIIEIPTNVRLYKADVQLGLLVGPDNDISFCTDSVGSIAYTVREAYVRRFSASRQEHEKGKHNRQHRKTMKPISEQ